jgi:Ca2+-transporting ATPase
VPLSAGAWVECLGLAMIVLVASELRKCVLRAMRE